MQEAEWYEPEIPGLSFEDITFHPENPATEEPHHRLLDGWLEVTIKCDGTNPFYPAERYWGYTFFTVTDGPPLRFKGVPGMRYYTLSPRERLVDGFIEETWYQVPNKGTMFGLWLNYGIRTIDGEVKRRGSLLYPTQQAAIA